MFSEKGVMTAVGIALSPSPSSSLIIFSSSSIAIAEKVEGGAETQLLRLCVSSRLNADCLLKLPGTLARPSLVGDWSGSSDSLCSFAITTQQMTNNKGYIHNYSGKCRSCKPDTILPATRLEVSLESKLLRFRPKLGTVISLVFLIYFYYNDFFRYYYY
jgi:hypothetical protein